MSCSTTFAWAAFTLLMITPLANGDLLTVTQTGNGSGTLNGNSFAASDFTITSILDTANRQSFPGGWFIDADSATISIGGLGKYNILTPTRIFVANFNQMVGFSMAGADGDDIFNGPTDSALSTWDMLGSMGPITGQATLEGTVFSQVNTSSGILEFEQAVTTSTFTAAIPEPVLFLPATLLFILMPARKLKVD